MKDYQWARAVLALMAALALAAFTYNQVAQARAARYRVLNPGMVIDTWSGELCSLTGCGKLRRESEAAPAKKYSPGNPFVDSTQ